jgi:integrating conjugative element protein (TIGR03757 family)
MNKRWGYLSFLGYLVCFTAQASQQVEIITSDQFPITGMNQLGQTDVQVKLYNLDDPKRLLRQFKQGLSPANKLEQNKTAIMKRFNALGKKALQQQFSKAYQGVVVGTKYQVTRYPVILFDQGASAIYGVTHLPDAWSLYQQSKEQR